MPPFGAECAHDGRPGRFDASAFFYIDAAVISLISECLGTWTAVSPS
jgi:hypothetical protein